MGSRWVPWKPIHKELASGYSFRVVTNSRKWLPMYRSFWESTKWKKGGTSWDPHEPRRSFATTIFLPRIEETWDLGTGPNTSGDTTHPELPTILGTERYQGFDPFFLLDDFQLECIYFCWMKPFSLSLPLGSRFFNER